MKSKREIDRDYYLRRRERVLARVAQYQKDYPESHREASRNYETKKRIRLKIIKERGLIQNESKRDIQPELFGGISKYMKTGDIYYKTATAQRIGL